MVAENAVYTPMENKGTFDARMVTGMKEKRREERVPIEVEVEVTIPGLLWRKKRILHTRDLSNNGVFVTCDGRQCPSVGTEIEIRLTGLVDGQDPPVVKARIVRIVKDGMAIQFLNP